MWVLGSPWPILARLIAPMATRQVGGIGGLDGGGIGRVSVGVKEGKVRIPERNVTLGRKLTTEGDHRGGEGEG